MSVKSTLMNEQKPDVGAEIRAWRNKRGLSQIELADAIEVTQRTIGRFESNQTSPKMDDLFAICRVLRVSPLKLLGGALEEIGNES